ncbi:hypothetical protein RYX36_022213 [Vicia faba]
MIRFNTNKNICLHGFVVKHENSLTKKRFDFEKKYKQQKSDIDLVMFFVIASVVFAEMKINLMLVESVPFVVLIGRYYDRQGNPTKYLKGVEAKAAKGAYLLEKQKIREAKQPSCSSSWSQDEGCQTLTHVCMFWSDMVRYWLPEVDSETNRNGFDWEDKYLFSLKDCTFFLSECSVLGF